MKREDGILLQQHHDDMETRAHTHVDAGGGEWFEFHLWQRYHGNWTPRTEHYLSGIALEALRQHLNAAAPPVPASDVEGLVQGDGRPAWRCPCGCVNLAEFRKHCRSCGGERPMGMPADPYALREQAHDLATVLEVRLTCDFVGWKHPATSHDWKCDDIVEALEGGGRLTDEHRAAHRAGAAPRGRAPKEGDSGFLTTLPPQEQNGAKDQVHSVWCHRQRRDLKKLLRDPPDDEWCNCPSVSAGGQEGKEPASSASPAGVPPQGGGATCATCGGSGLTGSSPGVDAYGCDDCAAPEQAAPALDDGCPVCGGPGPCTHAFAAPPEEGPPTCGTCHGQNPPGVRCYDCAAPCLACRGTGSKLHGEGMTATFDHCYACGGTGKAQPEGGAR